MMQKRVYFLNPTMAAVQAIPAVPKLITPPDGWARCTRKDYLHGLAVKRELARRPSIAA